MTFMGPLSYAVDFDVRVEPEHRLVQVTVSGVPSHEDIGWIAETVRAAILTLGEDAGDHCTLYDARGVPVLPQATADFVVANFAQEVSGTFRARRLALVAATTLTRRQIRRVAQARACAAVFDEVETARRWLLEGQDEGQRPPR